MGVESATCLSPQGELSRVPPATEHRKEARRAPALEAPGPTPRTPRSLVLERFTHALRRCAEGHCSRKSGG